jgi:D-xylose transport system permease protein
MSDQSPARSQPKRNVVQALQVDMRLLGMIGAFLTVCVVFNILTDGRFLTPRNIFNLTIQTVSVAIMATGMVFVIVTRHIDLSVGALLATCTAVMAMTQTQWLPQIFGLELGHPLIPWITIAVGLLTGAVIGAAQGWLVGYQAIPAFIVTLGGLLIWRNVGWWLTDGATIGPLDQTYVLFGGIGGTLGVFWSWVVGLAATAASLAAIWSTQCPSGLLRAIHRCLAARSLRAALPLTACPIRFCC